MLSSKNYDLPYPNDRKPFDLDPVKWHKNQKLVQYEIICDKVFVFSCTIHYAPFTIKQKKRGFEENSDVMSREQESTP